MAARVEVELDIFSGKPNPTWLLTNAETNTFVKKMAALPQGSAAERPGNLGYRGFIVRMTQGTDTQLVRIHAGTVHIVKGSVDVYGRDSGLELERWVLRTGKPHLDGELFRLADRESQ